MCRAKYGPILTAAVRPAPAGDLFGNGGMNRKYKGWKIILRTSHGAPSRAKFVSPTGEEHLQPWIEGHDEQDMLDHIKRRIDKIIAFEIIAPE